MLRSSPAVGDVVTEMSFVLPFQGQLQAVEAPICRWSLQAGVSGEGPTETGISSLLLIQILLGCPFLARQVILLVATLLFLGPQLDLLLLSSSL